MWQARVMALRAAGEGLRLQREMAAPLPLAGFRVFAFWQWWQAASLLLRCFRSLTDVRLCDDHGRSGEVGLRHVNRSLQPQIRQLLPARVDLFSAAGVSGTDLFPAGGTQTRAIVPAHRCDR